VSIKDVRGAALPGWWLVVDGLVVEPAGSRGCCGRPVLGVVVDRRDAVPRKPISSPRSGGSAADPPAASPPRPAATPPKGGLRDAAET
jgi:hypothetical protein